MSTLARRLTDPLPVAPGLVAVVGRTVSPVSSLSLPGVLNRARRNRLQIRVTPVVVGTQHLRMRLSASGVDHASAYYTGGGGATSQGTNFNFGEHNGQSMLIGDVNAQSMLLDMDIDGASVPERTIAHGMLTYLWAGGGLSSVQLSWSHDIAQAFDGFTIFQPTSGTFSIDLALYAYASPPPHWVAVFVVSLLVALFVAVWRV